MQTSREFDQYVTQHHLEDFCDQTVLSLQRGNYTLNKVNACKQFNRRIGAELLNHPIILHNDYCSQFQQGNFSKEEVRDFIIQFSVFSNQFLVAQLHKMLNAESIEEMRASKEILANEIGVIFSGNKPKHVADTELEGDPDVVSLDGSVDGGKFRFGAAHFEWLLRIGEHLDIGFNDMGKRKHGCESTLYFCDELVRIYGSDRYHTQEELEEYYFTRDVDEDRFIKDGNEMLDGVKVFWDGLLRARNSVH